MKKQVRLRNCRIRLKQDCCHQSRGYGERELNTNTKLANRDRYRISNTFRRKFDENFSFTPRTGLVRNSFLTNPVRGVGTHRLPAGGQRTRFG